MTQITTPIRLPKQDYKEYRRIALEEGKSFAEFVRQALKAYQKTEIDKESIKRRKAAARWLWKNRIPIDVPIKQLIEEGRKI